MKKEHIEDEDDVVFEESEEFQKESASKVKSVKEDLKKMKSERQEYLDGWQRSQAELINLKKRHEEDKKSFTKYATENFINELIPAMDSFDMAFRDKDAWEKAPENWRVGIEYIHNQLSSALENNGLNIINPIGEQFDHNLHNSIKTVPGKEGKILEVLQKGYELNGKVIRPANVVVGEGE